MNPADLIEQYRLLHEREPSYGRSSDKNLKYIRPFVRQIRPKSILDYGCGKSRMVDRLGVPKVYRYDPALPEYSVLPVDRVDMVVCTDVLEHVPEDDLDRVLAEIRGLSDQCFFIIALVEANETLPCGINAHVTIRGRGWWLWRLLQFWGRVSAVDERDEDKWVHFKTW